MDYKEAGVDIEKGDEFAAFVGGLVKDKLHVDPRVKAGIGGFSALYEISEEKYLAVGTDGVGTKLKVAQGLNDHTTIGIDLVAMCANDVLCCGSKPLLFLDYFACGSLDLGQGKEVMSGVVEGCRQAGAFLIGGETAEMPGLYSEGDYDLAGFCIAEVYKDKLIDGSSLKAGHKLLALSSSGPHSNGYSLIRKLIKTEDKDLRLKALTPTKIYVKTIHDILVKDSSLIDGMAHITGGGVHNIARINKNFGYRIDHLPPLEEIPEIFKALKIRSELPQSELYKTFNMGMGMVIATSKAEELTAVLKEAGEKVWSIGEVVEERAGEVFGAFE